MSLGENIRAARKALGITLEELGKKAKAISSENIRASTSHLSQVERNIRPPSLKVLTAIALALNTSVSKLTADETKETAIDETANKVVGQLVEATRKGRVQDWVERIASIAQRAQLPLERICWQGSPYCVSTNVVACALETGNAHRLKAALETY